MNQNVAAEMCGTNPTSSAKVWLEQTIAAGFLTQSFSLLAAPSPREWRSATYPYADRRRSMASYSTGSVEASHLIPS